MDSKQLGILGEKIAENYLKRKGYQILDRNYSIQYFGGPKRGEIDIIAKNDNIISFIEVKTLCQKNSRSQNFLMKGFSPEGKVNWLKQRKIIKVAQSWLMKKKIPLDSKWQIDVIALKLDLENKKAKIRHFKNAVFNLR